MSATNIYNSEDLETLRRKHGLDPQHVREFRNAACKKFVDRDALTRQFPLFADSAVDSLEIAQRCDSSIDGATKLLMRTRSGMLIETVILRISSGRTTLCVSSQVGCAAACDFCATGKMGVAQNLTPQEILDQVRLAGQILAQENGRIRNVVFMGMGEPFHNEAQLYETLEILTCKNHFNLSPARILVSTVGIADAIVRCAERFPQVNIALSLHSVNQVVRERIIPLAKKFSLHQLRSAIVNANSLQSKPVMLEYLMLRDANDALDDAKQLIEWARDLNVHLNLIPYNPIEDAPHLVGSDPETIQAFASALKAAGLQTTVRYSLGADIAAACGQLVQQENRRIARINNS